jgi:pentatricopeptide repeat protein
MQSCITMTTLLQAMNSCELHATHCRYTTATVKTWISQYAKHCSVEQAMRLFLIMSDLSWRSMADRILLTEV